MPPRLLNETELERSAVTSNATMNRGRGLMGSNSYTRDLGFNPVDFLKERCPRVVPGQAPPTPPSWLDLCCGSGRALTEAAERLEVSRPGAAIMLVGIDLMPLFEPVPAGLANLRLIAGSLATWEPPQQFDLITCVHGLHYLGDELARIARAVSWLAPGGQFAAHLDPDHLRWENGEPAGPQLLRELRAAGLRYDVRRRLLTCEGPRAVAVHPFLGADDQAGPNYTGQEAVASYYRRAD